MNGITIVSFSNELAHYFTQYNTEWLEKYFVVEAIDEKILSDPRKHIIDQGGYIFFAKMNEKVVGTFALVKLEECVYELSKMAVNEAFQGKQIGNQLLAFCIEKARELNAEKIILYSSTKLKPAIHLYEKYGFVEVDLGNTDYQRADIKMELKINVEHESN